jgi:hypothetical protein
MKNIVWLASYPKSGNTWFRIFLTNYQANKNIPASLDEIQSTPVAGNAHEFEEIITLNPFELTEDEVNFYRPELYKAISEMADNDNKAIYRKVHDAYILNTDRKPLFSAEVSKGIVYFIRNPMDVCVSFANHDAEEVEETINLLLNEDAHLAGEKTGQLRQKLLSWKSHVQSWKNQTKIPILFVRYEDMIQKPEETFGAIIRFLDLEFDVQRLRRAITFSNFKLLQEMEQKNGFKERPQKCQHFFWKGKIGNYRDYLSKDQINQIVEYNYDTMKEFGYIDESGALTV